MNELSVWAWAGILRELTFIDDGEEETSAGMGGVGARGRRDRY
jgi:hypothetical protein